MSHAVAAAGTGLVTADELFRMRDDGMRRELVDGELHVMTPAGGRHGQVALRVGSRLEQYVAENDLGAALGAETGFKLSVDPDTVLAPDLSFVREVAEGVSDVDAFWPVVPDFVLEVASPRDAFHDVRHKVSRWLDAGCRLVAVADPGGRVMTVRRSRSDIVELTEDDVLDAADVVPGWKPPLRGMFG